MSSTIHNDYRFFAAGILVGLAFGGVTLLTVGAARRAQRRRIESASASHAQAHGPFIDGVHPPCRELLDARPHEELSMPGTLASERPDFEVNSQRW